MTTQTLSATLLDAVQREIDQGVCVEARDVHAALKDLYSFGQVQDALAYLEHGDKLGRVVRLHGAYRMTGHAVRG
jgi:hypothetical protein